MEFQYQFATIAVCTVAIIYVSGNTITKIIDKLLELEEAQHDLTEIIMNMSLKWKQKQARLTTKLLKINEKLEMVESWIHRVETSLHERHEVYCTEMQKIHESINAC